MDASPRRSDIPTPPRSRRGRRAVSLLAAGALVGPLVLAASAAPASAAARTDPGQEAEKLARELVKRSGAEDASRHLRALQAISDANEGHRAAGSPGHEQSAKYAGTLLEAAGYQVTYQNFEFTYRETLAEKLSVRSPNPRDVPVKLMTYTKSTPVGGIEAAIAPVPVDTDGSSGCTGSDYASGGYDGKIALIKRGGCPFAEKQAAAAGAGAAGALIYNNTEGELNGTLGDTAAARIPTGGITQAHGEELAAEAGKGAVTVNLELREFQEQRRTPNVIAESRGGGRGDTVMFGGHLDSVADGPGINDNGSGAAGVLETALQLAKATKGTHGLPNKVRFALWSAEELGLQGSEHYVSTLPEAERKKIALYLNFDMIASPNYGLFVYDGDDSDGTGAGPGPEGSAELEARINAFLRSLGQTPRGTDFSGRSDYGPFIDVGIPAGGTFTGAEGLKTADQQKLWGGTAGEAYDGCYHQACDDISNIDKKAFDVNIKAIADSVGRYAWDTSALP